MAAATSAAEQHDVGWPLPAAVVARTESIRRRVAMLRSADTREDACTNDNLRDSPALHRLRAAGFVAAWELSLAETVSTTACGSESRPRNAVVIIMTRCGRCGTCTSLHWSSGWAGWSCLAPLLRPRHFKYCRPVSQ